MFSSNKDLVAVLELVVFIAVVSGVLVYLKVYSPFVFIYGQLLYASSLIQKFSYFLFIPVGLELVFLAFFRKVRID